jgi:hypothetical protein
LSGCATYKLSHGKAPNDKGYVASIDDTVILEYTLGQGDTVPSDLDLAKERLKRRKDTVEDYYKKMGKLESRFKQTLINWPKFMLQTVTGPFRMPFAAVRDYKYEHNAQYRERIRKREEAEDAKEAARVKGLKEKLAKYIQRDLAAEEYINQKFGVKKEDATKLTEQEVKTEAQPAQIYAEVKPQESLPEKQVEPAQKEKTIFEHPRAFIMAKPVKGFSPLKVHFYAIKSFSPRGRIVSYLWDFGDGDTSTKMNPINTYYSGNFEPKNFPVTLTIQDNKGNTATAEVMITVLNK